MKSKYRIETASGPVSARGRNPLTPGAATSNQHRPRHVITTEPDAAQSVAMFESAHAFDAATEFAIEHRGVGLTAMAADAIALAVASVGAAAAETLIRASPTVPTQSFVFSTTLVRLLVSVPLMVLLLASTGAHWRLRTTVGEQLSAIAPAMAIGGLVSLAGWRMASGAGLVRAPAPDAVLVMCALGIFTVTLVRLANHGRPSRDGRRARRALIVGSGLVAARVIEQFNASGAVEVVGFVDDDPVDHTGYLGKLRELASVCESEEVDHVVVCFSRSKPEELIDALRPMQGRVPITVVPRLFDVLPVTANVHELGSGLIGMSVPPASLGWGARAAKRTMDVIGASIALLLLLPILGLVGIAIKTTSQGPVIFRQVRVGRHCQGFRILKFRTMKVEHSVTHPTSLPGEATRGPFKIIADDPRVTRVGRLLRRTSLDELPQLWNVIRGEMSLVGPRPLPPEQDDWITDWAQRRHLVRPGITGLWQVSGRSDLKFDEMCRLDSQYIAYWSPSLDIRILLRTLPAVINRSGAY